MRPGISSDYSQTCKDEYDYISLSSSNRDEEHNSEFDRFESFLSKNEEALYIQNKCNCEQTMKQLENMYGPFSQDEIDFYTRRLSEDADSVINKFQKELIFNLFYKYFGDPISINAINREDYIKLLIIARRMLESSNLVILPWILSSKVKKIQYKKTLNKREMVKIQTSKFYSAIERKYRNNKKTEAQMYFIIGTILSSEFVIIDYTGEMDGKLIPSIQPDYIVEEVMQYITMI